MEHLATKSIGMAVILGILAIIGAAPGPCTAGERADPDSNPTGHVELGIASNYPNDAGIESNAAVEFTENFEQPTIADLLVGWEYNTNSARMSFSPDTPSGSGGSQSVFFDGSADLYTRLLPGHDQLYVRYYAKVETECNNVHHWPWLGGHNPSTAWPWPRAGIRPVGDERFSTGIEPYGDWWAWAFYTYWMHMRTNPGGSYWGNTFSGKPSPHTAHKGQWICIEFMVKMNDPVTEPRPRLPPGRVDLGRLLAECFLHANGPVRPQWLPGALLHRLRRLPVANCPGTQPQLLLARALCRLGSKLRCLVRRPGDRNGVHRADG